MRNLSDSSGEMEVSGSASNPETLIPDTDEEEEEEESTSKSQPLIPGLPNEIAELCLLHLPYPYQALVRSVSSSWNRAITSPRFLLSKQSLSLSSPYLFVLAFNRSTARIQWQALDLPSGRWFLLPPMPCPRASSPHALSCASIPRSGKLFVLGGMSRDADTSTRSALVYSAWTNQWSFASPMLNQRSYFAAGSVRGKIVAVGGSVDGISDSISAVESYDPESDTWTAAAELPTALAKYDSAVIGGKMYVTEGWTWPFMFPPRGEVYDSNADTWREMSGGMKEGWTGVSVVIGDRLFVISEHGDCPMKVYSPDDDTWRFVSGQKLPRQVLRRPFAVTGADDRVLVVAAGCHVAVGRVTEGQNGDFSVEWRIIAAPKAFSDFSPASCHVLYA